jgi:palmitoyltransferase
MAAVSMAPQPNLRPPPGGTTVSTIRVDGVQGEVKVQVRSNTAAPLAMPDRSTSSTDELLEKAAELKLGLNQTKKSGGGGRSTIEEDFMA